MPFRLAALSDLHLDRRSDPDSWELVKAAFDAVCAMRPDHVVITGDLFDSASAMQRDRDRVRSYLRRCRVWHRDRLTVVVGNHDIFRLAHRGSVFARAAELRLAARADADASYRAFSAWAGELVPQRGRYFDDDLFPFRKDLDHLTLLAADTTGQDTAHSVNGYWRRDDDQAARELLAGGTGRKVLAIHHPPELEEERGILRQLATGAAFGFPVSYFERLEKFADDVRLDAAVCGHIHVGAPRTWRLGRRTRVFRCGETGGLDGATPSFLMLEIPRRGAVRCQRIKI